MSEQGKIALVTDASRGPGFEAARRLAERGVKALLGARSEERGKEIEAKLRSEGFEAEFILLDVNDEETQESAARVIKEKFGKLDILVNNAGSALESSAGLEIQAASQTPMEIYRKTFEANFFALLTLTQKLLPLVKKSEAGRVVNLSGALESSTHHTDPASFLYDFKAPAYDASRAAVNSFTAHLAYELKDTPIKVNAAHPGWAPTDAQW
jgi:NAD(P)-dependent dehydrogenase (short-subunit alcohol dehydrogenase family)